jgi:hypothetical protein
MCKELGRTRIGCRRGKPEGKRPLGRPALRWVGNIKMDLGDRIGWYELD